MAERNLHHPPVCGPGSRPFSSAPVAAGEPYVAFIGLQNVLTSRMGAVFVRVGPTDWVLLPSSCLLRLCQPS